MARVIALTLSGLNELDAAGSNFYVASLTTALAGANNDLKFTAKTGGINDITIAYVNPGVETPSESVVVTGHAIVVTLRSVSSVLSTAAQVAAALADNALVTV